MAWLLVSLRYTHGFLLLMVRPLKYVMTILSNNMDCWHTQNSPIRLACIRLSMTVDLNKICSMQAALTSMSTTVLDGNNLATAPKVVTSIGCQGTVQKPAENAVSFKWSRMGRIAFLICPK